MTPQPQPYDPRHSQPSAPAHRPSSPSSDEYMPVAGADCPRQPGRVPDVSTYFPTSVTAVSQADGEP